MLIFLINSPSATYYHFSMKTITGCAFLFYFFCFRFFISSFAFILYRGIGCIGWIHVFLMVYLILFISAEFPWVVAIIHKVHDNDVVVNVYKCGGSLIHPSVIITAAHCVVDLKDVHDIMVRAGEWDTQTLNEPFPHQDRAVADVLIHEHYTRGSHFNDVALLFLDKPVELAENVNTICLPPQDYDFDHQRCFGKIFFFFDNYQFF